MDELLELARKVVEATRTERHLLSGEGQQSFAELASWLATKGPETCPGNAAQE